MSEGRITTQPSARHDAAPQDLIVIAAMFTAALYREHGLVVDVELIHDLLTRLQLGPLSAIREAQ